MKHIDEWNYIVDCAELEGLPPEVRNLFLLMMCEAPNLLSLWIKGDVENLNKLEQKVAQYFFPEDAL